jgi:hypothetical protein
MLVMQVNVFDKFDLNAKACITWQQGVHLCCRAQGPYYMALYRLDNFYVEIQYHTCFDGISSINTFLYEEQLQAYLEKVDIDNLFQ